MTQTRLVRMLGLVVLLCAVLFCTTPSSSWKDHTSNGYSTTDDDTVSLVQLVFVSCARHDYYQTYWAQIATATQCELAPRTIRIASPICRALYAGQTPPSTPTLNSVVGKLPRLSHAYPVLLSELGIAARAAKHNAASHQGDNEEEEDVVRAGACGAVLDSPDAMLYRSEYITQMEHNNNITSLLPDDGKDVDDGAWWPVQHAATTPKDNNTSSNSNSDTLRYRPPVDALVWLGDAIYADKRMRRGPRLPVGHVVYPIHVVEKMWQTQRRGAEYTAFRETCLAARPRLPFVERTLILSNSTSEVDDERSVVGTWDDHDMGTNDGGAEYPLKDITQRFFLRFLNASAEDPRWGRSGVYIFHTLPFVDHHTSVSKDEEEVDEEDDDDSSSSEERSSKSVGQGSSSDQSASAIPETQDDAAAVVMQALRAVYRHAVCLVLLDGRYFRDPANATRAGDMLGAAQWAWFETLLKHSLADNVTSEPHKDGKVPCAVTLIGHGIQFMLDEKPTENWAAFPHSRDRLLGLLRHYHTQRVALLTGDVHMGELGLDSTPRTVQHILGYPLVEATSSGLTHTTGDMPLARPLLPYLLPTPRRVGLYVEKNFATARLSFDPRQLSLGTLRAITNATRQLQSNDTTSVESQRAPRITLQAQLEAIVNLTFTVFAIDQWGKPVLRLRVPLEMLIERKGADYVNARAEPTDGMVYKAENERSNGDKGDALPRREYTTIPVFADQNERSTHSSGSTGSTSGIHRYKNISVVHYHSTTPVPFITAFARRMQANSFPHRSVTDSLLRGLQWAAALTFIATLLLVAACMLSCRYRCRLSTRRMAYHRANVEATSATGTTAAVEMQERRVSGGVGHSISESLGAMSSEGESASTNERAALALSSAAERESMGGVRAASSTASSSRKRSKME